MKIAIVGGGIIGLCCAFYLQQDGHEITVIEKGDITQGCSFGNMGYISPSHFTPLATPGIVSQGIKWMLNSSSPFYIRPRFNLALLKWGAAFYRQANLKTLQQNIPALHNLLTLSRELISQLQKDIGEDFSLTETGCWMLYKNEHTGDHEKKLAEEAGKMGLKTIICTKAEVQQYEKEVEVDVAGGVLYTDDCYVDPAKLMTALYNFLIRKKVRFVLNTKATGFEKNGQYINSVITPNEKIITDQLIIASGSWLPETARLLGIRTLLQPGKGYSFNYGNLKNNLTYPSILVDNRVATTPYGRRLRIGGTMELSGHNDKMSPKRIAAIYQAFKLYYPSMPLPAPQADDVWYGYRPVTPDGLPYIGKHSAYNNLLFAGGHAMLGVTAAPGTGKLISEIINGEKTSVDVTRFSPQRFG